MEDLRYRVLEKDLKEVKNRVDAQDEAIFHIGLMGDKVDEHHEILVNKASFVTYGRFAVGFSIAACILALLSVVLQLLKYL